MDLFKYRVQLSPDQFIEKGFAERKMLLVLDIYDMLKHIKRQHIVDKKKNMKDVRFEHGGEMPVRAYAVVDHTKGVAKKMQFNMNAAMKKISVTCQHETEFVAEQAGSSAAAETERKEDAVETVNDEQGEKSNDGEEKKSVHAMQQSVMSHASEAQSVYSVSNHFKVAQRNHYSNTKAQKQTKADNVEVSEVKLGDQEPPVPSQSRGEKMGTSQHKEPVIKQIRTAVSTVKEDANESDSEFRKSSPTFTNKEASFQQNAGQTTTFSENAENTRAITGQDTLTDNELQLVTALTETIATMGGKFEEMGASFEAKLQTIEARHKELEQKLNETA